ncbi:MAG: CHAT domain-containing protein [Candidatus Kapabacteria bacterium]|nr:CHAT domain-containing protein [Candidatus Kapabacteria bacterium]
MKFSLLIITFILFSFISFSQDWKSEITKTNELIIQEKFEEAEKSALISLKLAEEEFGSQSEYYAQSLSLLGEINYNIGNFDKSIDYYTKAKNLKKKTLGEKNESYLTTLNNLSVVYQSIGRYFDAEPILLDIIRIKKEIYGENDTSYAVSMNNLGQLYTNIGKYPEAEDLLKKSLKIKGEKLGNNSLSYAVTSINLGYLYKLLGNYDEAIKYYETAVNIYENSKNASIISKVRALNSLANVYMDIGENQKAETLLKKAEKLSDDITSTNPSDNISTMYNIGIIHWANGNLAQAEKMLNQTLEKAHTHLGNSHPLFSSCLNSLGIVRWQMGKLDEALKNLKEAVFLRKIIYGEKHPAYANSLHVLAGLQKEMGNFEEAEKNYRIACNLYIQKINTYFPFLSDRERTKFYVEIKERFDLFYNYVISRYDENPVLLADMFNYRTATKAILLNSQKTLRNRIAATQDNSIMNIYQSWKNHCIELSKIYSQTLRETQFYGQNIDSLETEINTIEKNLSRKISYIERERDKKTIKWEDIRKSLSNDEAAIEIIRFNTFNRNWTDTIFYVALIITRETVNFPDIVLLKNGKALENRYFRNYSKSLIFRIPDKISYNVFWEQIESKIKGKKNIFISTDGIYNKINISSLLRPDNSYVIDDFNIKIVSNTNELIFRDKKFKLSSNQALLFGNPNFNNTPFPPLPGTKEELSNISEKFIQKKWNVQLFENDQATELNLKKAPKKGLIHIATHGFFFETSDIINPQNIFGLDFKKLPENPLLTSGLIFSKPTLEDSKSFSDENSDDGIFTAFEVLSMDLDKVELLVLSACETGLGQIKNGEGVYGLQRAFMIAGVKNLIMSLWKINDFATQYLMNEFYSNLTTGSNLDDSFRKAILSAKEKYNHPYYWGSFIFVSSN